MKLPVLLFDCESSKFIFRTKLLQMRFPLRLWRGTSSSSRVVTMRIDSSSKTVHLPWNAHALRRYHQRREGLAARTPSIGPALHCRPPTKRGSRTRLCGCPKGLCADSSACLCLEVGAGAVHNAVLGPRADGAPGVRRHNSQFHSGGRGGGGRGALR